MKTGKTWILIADGGHARVLETTGMGHDLSQVQLMASASELPPSRELGTDRVLVAATTVMRRTSHD